MAPIRPRRKRINPSSKKNDPFSKASILLLTTCIACTVIIIFIIIPSILFRTDNNNDDKNLSRSDRLRQNAKQIASRTADKLHLFDKTEKYGLPARIRYLRDRNEIVGDRLGEIKEGIETVEEILHDNNNNYVMNVMDGNNYGNYDMQPPFTIQEITSFFGSFLSKLHETCLKNKHESHVGIWNTYHNLALKMLYPWDREYLKRMPKRRKGDDGSIFLSVVSYRDENCLSTIQGAYEKAERPDKLFVGLVQQNCEEEKCRSGVLEGGTMKDVDPDEDCYKVFCESDIGKPHCEAERVRFLRVQESESLGPYAARYFASKLWYGEQWYMQIDSHMTFAQNWDTISIEMLKKAPSKKPILSHYPPSEKQDLEALADKPAPRLCGPEFATSDLESQIIRLEGGTLWDKTKLDVPRFAPFTAAGYFVAHSDFLHQVPFDPFLPYIFMGEEIIMSARLWTSGYDIFSPSRSVVGHIYVRRHKPKFWESVHRTFTFGVHNPLQMLILNRIKFQLGYPESARDMIKPKSVLTAVEQYSMGDERSLEEYLRIVGLDMREKRVNFTGWCETGKVPPGKEEYAYLYGVE